MEQKNRTVLVIAIAITVIVAVLLSFGVPALTGQVPEVSLPDISQEASGGGDLLPVEVTPDTVQSVIATLSRPESCYRELAVTLYWSGGSSSSKVQIWADGDYVKTVVGVGGVTQHRLVGDGKLCLWYGGDKSWKEIPATEGSFDLAQRIPTYEDVLALNQSLITDAGYQVKNGKDCVFVEVRDTDLGYLDRYWVETATGLLCAAETLSDGVIVYSMTEEALEIPLKGGFVFELPDGTVIHTGSAVQEEDGGQG
ncbi:MAG: hypothetical protein IKU62_06175 [Ruminiclostridium sp.]|nr:hypothetical protein [Ruminiclostridium sp.]